MSGGGGFSADQAGITQLATFVGDRAVDLRGVRSTLLSVSEASEDILGEAAGAYGTFLEAWADEFSLNADALDEIGIKFGAAAAAYTQHDVYWSQKFRAFIPPNQ